MAIDDRTLRTSRRMRVILDKHVDAVTRDLTAAWVKAWDDLADQWQAALDDVLAYQAANGAWPPAWRLARLQRVAAALEATRAALDALAASSGARIIEVLPTVTTEAAEWQAKVIATQAPSQAGTQAQLAVRFNRVDQQSLDAIVQRSTQQVTALTAPLSDEATAVMNRHLVRGVALGDNPRTVAARIIQDVEGGFNGGLARALTISRTEMLSAHRAASRAQRIANPETVVGWKWIATLDRRTCPSCLAMNGEVFPPDTEGPNDHQNGRCTSVPVLASWKDLGFDVEEPPDTFPDSRAWYDALPDADQVAIMGPERAAMLKAGDIGWDDLSTTKSNPGWRDSQVPTTVSDLRRRAAA